MLCMVSFAVLRFLGLIMSHLFLLFIYFFIFGFSGSSLLCASFLLLPQGGASLHCSEQWLLLLHSTGFRHTGLVAVVCGLSCPMACGIFPDQESNPCALHYQADFYTLCHQGSPIFAFICTTLEDSPRKTSTIKTENMLLCSLLGVLWCHVLYLSL